VQHEQVIQDYNIHKTYDQIAVLKTCSPRRLFAHSFPFLQLVSTPVCFLFMFSSTLFQITCYHLSQFHSFSSTSDLFMILLEGSMTHCPHLTSLITHQSVFYTHHKHAGTFCRCSGFFFISLNVSRYASAPTIYNPCL
jgi:hypothetical protein